MSPKKIDSKKVVESIFGVAGGPATPLDEERVTALLGKRAKKTLRLRSWWKGLSLRWGSWRNEFGAIDVGSDSIKFVLLAQDKRRLWVQDVQIEKLLQVAPGEKPAEHEKEVLNGLVKIASRIKPKLRIGISLNDPSLYMESLTVPAATDEEYREAIRKELSEKRLIDPETSFFDYTMENGTEKKGGNQDLLVIAAPKDLVYQQFEMVQSAGFRVLAVETNALATIEALRRVARWSHEERSLILDIGSRFTSLSIVLGERLAFSRIIPIAGERFTKVIQDACGCNFDQAEQLKFKYGVKERLEAIRKTAALEGAEAGQRVVTEGERVSEALLKEIGRLLAEVERSFQFAFARESATEGMSIRSVFLIGGGSRVAGLKEYLEKRWETAVRSVNLWEGLTVDEHNVDQTFLQETNDLVSVSLGLALRIKEWKVLPFEWGMPG